MQANSRSHIDTLIDRVQEAAKHDHLHGRGQNQPRATFALEDPIASAQIFGYDVSRYFSDPWFYVEQTLRQKLWRWENFPEDDAPITAEIPASLGYYPEYTYAGMGVEFDPVGVPIIQTDHPLTRDPDLGYLKPVAFMTSGWMPRVLRWYEDIERIAAGRIKVTFGMAWWRGCLDLAIQLRGYDQFVMDTVERPGFAHDLVRFLVEQRCRWWEAYYRHFGLAPKPEAAADDWINVPFISPGLFRDFVLPRYLEIETFHGGITSVHSCGNQTPIQGYLLEIRSLPGLEVSAWTDLAQSLINVPPEKSLGISLHPNDVLFSPPEEMETKLRDIVDACRGRRYNIGTSGLTPILGSTDAFVAKIRTWTSIARRVLEPVRSAAAVPSG